jgi:hypothetical protein
MVECVICNLILEDREALAQHFGEKHVPEYERAVERERELAELHRQTAGASKEPESTTHTTAAAREDAWIAAERLLPPKWSLSVSGPSNRDEPPYTASATHAGTARIRARGWTPEGALNELVPLLKGR